MIVESKLIRPTGVEHKKYPLSGLDLVFGFHFVATVCFLDKDYDIAVLEPAMQETINRIPVVAGKIVNENGCLVLDTDGPGVQFSYETADQPAPELDDLIFPISGYEFFNPIPSIFGSDISEMPLLTIKVTTFSDGIKCVGIRHNHVIMDGTAMYSFMCTWMDCLEGRAPKPLVFSRDVVTPLANREWGLPSVQSGIGIADGQLAPPAPIFFQNFFHTIEINADFRQLLELTKARLKGVISINHLMTALVFKAYGLSSKQSDSEPARANLSYDVRMLKDAQLPFSFFGNAVLFRSMELSFGELRSIDLLSLAQQFKQLAQPNIEATSQDIGFYQSQYEQGNYNKAGVYSNFSSVLGNGGLYINNLLHIVDDPANANFGGHTIRGDVVLPREHGVRTAILMPTVHKGLLIRLALEAYQAAAFEKNWSNLVSELLQRQVFATA